MSMTFGGDAASLRPGDRFLEWKAVKSLTGFSRTTAWRRQKAGDFPAPRQISPGRVCWLESEVSAWQASRARPGETTLPAFRSRPVPKAPPTTVGPPAQTQASNPPEPIPAPSPTPERPVQTPTAVARPKTRRRRPIDPAQAAFDF